jgi:hypothetical protein
MNKQMTPAQIELVHQSFDLLTHEVSDEALEAAGKNEARNFTMAACTFHVGCAG